MNKVNEDGAEKQPYESIQTIQELNIASTTVPNQESTYKTLLSQFSRFQNVLSPHISSQAYIFKESYQSLLSEQNQTVLLTPHNSPEAHQIKTINYQLNKNDADLAYFWPLWNSHPQTFIRNIEFIIQKENWDLYRYDFERAFEFFLYIYEKKMSKASFLRQLYPGLQQLVEKIAKVIQYDPKKQHLSFEETHTMVFYEYYLREMQSKNKLQGAFYVQDEQKQNKMPIGDAIARSPLFQGNHQWADIFLRAGIFKRVQLDKQPYVDRDLQEESRRCKENRQILKKRLNEGEDLLSPEDRPCCMQYFYFNYRIYDQTICSCHLLTQRKFKALWETAQLKQQTSQKPQKSQKSEAPKNEKSQKPQIQKQKAKQSAQLLGTLVDICALLNSGGGVILFNVFRNYLQTWPKGELIEQFKFQAARQLFADKLQCIHPSVELNREIFINFVPVVKNPINEGLAEIGKKKYIQGLYVMRIVVRPREQSAEYIYFIPNDNEPFQVSMIENGTSKVLPLRQAIKFMKKKYAYYYIPETQYADEEQLAMLRRGYSHFQDHDVCLQPDRGLPLIRKAAPQEKLDLQKIQSKFKYLTLIVAPRQYHGVIAQQLRSKGMDCEIVIRYEQYKLRPANNSAALFHNTRPDLLLAELAYRKEYQFNGKYVITILVTPFIKLLRKNKHNHMSLQDFKTLQMWLKTEHPKESLTLWRYEQSDENHEFYLQTGSKMSTLFMYYVMNHYGEKCSLKNPNPGYERMAEHERNAKMTIFYPIQSPEAQTSKGRT